jgi:hypothetical protein
MNATSCAVGALLSLGLLASGPAVAADVFSDRLCPRASAPVTSYATLSKNENSSVDSVIVAAREAIAAYELCGKEDLAGGASEGLHYTQVRQAQFYVAIGRLQRLTNLRDDARKSLQTAIDLTKDSIDWTSSSQTIFRSNNAGVGSGSTHAGAVLPSTYHDGAVTIRDAAKVEIDRLANASAPPVPATAAPSALKP